MTRRVVSLVVAVVVVLGVAIGAYFALTGTSYRYVTAYFPQAIGIYPESSVRILGVQVGSVTSVVPEGTQVKVTLEYASQYSLPANVDAVIVPPSIISDRYIQLAPVYTGGATLADHAVLPASRTEIPVELDQIFEELNQLNIALGPKGANKSGALANLIRVSAENLKGNGAQFNATINEFSQAIGTLSDNRGTLFQTLANLEKFSATLANDDGGVRTVADQLAVVGTQLNDERSYLGLALRNLAQALGQVYTFVRQNRAVLTKDVSGLTTITTALVTQKRAIETFLDDAPTALSNLSLTYDATTHNLRTRSNTSEGFANPSSPSSPICQLLAALDTKLCDPSTPTGLLSMPVVPQSGPAGSAASDRAALASLLAGGS